MALHNGVYNQHCDTNCCSKTFSEMTLSTHLLNHTDNERKMHCCFAMPTLFDLKAVSLFVMIILMMTHLMAIVVSLSSSGCVDPRPRVF